MWKSSLLLVFPTAYILLDAFLVVFIKLTSVHGKTSYNTVTANALTEFIKLGVATYGVLSSDSWNDLIASLTFKMILKFGASNALYAVNNNLFHYSIGAVSPAVFVVSINAMRTILTAIFQRFVSGKTLSNRQIVACVLLALSFIFTSLNDILEIVYFGNFRGSKFSLLLVLAGSYSSISVCASLVQEKLLKDAPNLMIANVINYSYGLFLQLSMAIYFKVRSPEVAMFRGFDIFWIQLIPVFMACSGISISFVLKYFDNIVKLLCSSIAVLLVHAVTRFMSGEDLLDVCFICGWLLTMPAAYLYYVTPPSTVSPSQQQGSGHHTDNNDTSGKKGHDFALQAVKPHMSEIDKKDKDELKSPSSASSSSSQSINRTSLRIALVIAMLLVVSLYNSSFNLPSMHRIDNSQSSSPFHVSTGDGTVSYTASCPLHEVPYDDSQSHLKNLVVSTIHSGVQFTKVDVLRGLLEVKCPVDGVYVLRPDIPQQKNTINNRRKYVGNNEWVQLDSSRLLTTKSQQQSTHNHHNTTRYIRRTTTTTTTTTTSSNSELNGHHHNDISYIIPLESVLKTLGGGDVDDVDNLPYFWVYCKKHNNANLVAVPTTIMSAHTKTNRLSAAEKNEVKQYVQSLSGAFTTATDNQPVFEKVLVIYLDAISRVKFNNFYEQSKALLTSIQYAPDSSSIHTAYSSSSSHVSVEFTKFHALGINSHVNYLPMMSGIQPDESMLRFKQAPVRTEVVGNKTSSGKEAPVKGREPWLFDLAELLGYETLSGYNGCHNNCKENCHELFKSQNNIEVGGYTKQYMQDSNDRLPGMLNWPSASTCESMFRSEVRGKMCDKCRLEEKPLPMSNMLDWTLGWLQQTDNRKVFASLVFEDTHRHGHATNFDADLEAFLSTLLFPSSSGPSLVNTDKLAILLLADHGMHFGPEYMTGTGKIANKQPFAHMILPRAYADSHKSEMSTLMHNSKLLTTHFDFRATVQSWLTGRDTSAAKRENKQAAVTSGATKTLDFASHYGNSLVSTEMATNRTCQQAGVSTAFCGCNLTPCESNIRPLVKTQFAAVADFMNHKVFDTSPNAKSVCIPLTAGDFMFVPGGFDCLTVEHENMRTFEVNLVITRNNALVGVTFGQDIKNKEGDKKHRSDGAAWYVISVNTASNYGRVWPQCAAQFVSQNIAHYNTIEPTNWQYCYCKTSREINYGPWLKIFGLIYK